MPKSRDAFRTISEVAEWLETPAHVLRFWESKFTQVKPVKRAGGRRYYRPSDMELLGGIKKLLHDDGMTIKGVQKVLREQGVRHVSALSVLRVEPEDNPQGELIEDAPYAEVPLADAPDSVIPYPSRTDTPAAEPAHSEPPTTSPADVPEPMAKDLAEVAEAAETPGAEISEPDMTDPVPEPEPEVEKHLQPDATVAPAADLFTPADSPELPFDLFSAAESAPSAAPETEETQAPAEVVEPVQPALPEPEMAEGVVPEPVNAALPDDNEETGEAEQASQVPVEADETGADAPPVPEPEPARETVPEVLAAQTRTRPLDLPDFDAAPSPAPVAHAHKAAKGPLGFLAGISALSPEKQRLVAAHLPALRSLCESRADTGN